MTCGAPSIRDVNRGCEVDIYPPLIVPARLPGEGLSQAIREPLDQRALHSQNGSDEPHIAFDRRDN